MKIIPPTSGEILFNQAKRLLMLNPLAVSGYYGQLFMVFKFLLDDEDRDELDKKIKDIENWLSDDLNILTLDEAEMRMYQNLDLLSGFEVKGQFITQMEINKRLEEIKTWLNMKFFELLPSIRFSTPIRIE